MNDPRRRSGTRRGDHRVPSQVQAVWPKVSRFWEGLSISELVTVAIDHWFGEGPPSPNFPPRRASRRWFHSDGRDRLGADVKQLAGEDAEHATSPPYGKPRRRCSNSSPYLAWTRAATSRQGRAPSGIDRSGSDERHRTNASTTGQPSLADDFTRSALGREARHRTVTVPSQPRLQQWLGVGTRDVRFDDGTAKEGVQAMIVAEFPTLAVNMFAVVVIGVAAIAAWLSLRPKHQ